MWFPTIDGVGNVAERDKKRGPRYMQIKMIGTRLFCEEEESISNSSHSEEESMGILKEKSLTLDEQLEKAIYSNTKLLYYSTKKSTSYNKIMKQEMQLLDSAENPSPKHYKTIDEEHFWLNGYVNKQNCRIWSEANLQVYVETPLHPEKLTVWCALWAGGILLQKR
ncbi:hypothetical protein TNCV_4193861 [Trichonephila clavipes]|nr:hypothetical protein TNCV_4193861 [Trichonephila clavipes]